MAKKAKVIPMRRKRADQIRDALEQIRLKHGGILRPRNVVDEARNPRHVLHNEFDWLDRSAADKHRLDRARELIQCVVVFVTTKAVRASVPIYVRHAGVEPREQGYAALTSRDFQQSDAEFTLNREVSAIERSVERARNIAHLLEARFPGIEQQLQQLLEQIVLVRKLIAAA